jgi:hypothetical protein
MDKNCTRSEKVQYAGLNMELDGLSELEHLSWKLKDRKVKFPEARCLICLIYCVSMTYKPGEFFEEAQNAVNNLEFQGIKLESAKVCKVSQQDLFLKLSGDLGICMFTTRASHVSSGSDTLSSGGENTFN